jgi:DNA mismatch repair protein MutS
VPRGVVTRAEAVLRALEQRARGLDPLSDELPLFARAAAPLPSEAAEPPVLAALRALDPDTLSPREAQEALYRLKSLAESTSALGPAVADTIVSRE